MKKILGVLAVLVVILLGLLMMKIYRMEKSIFLLYMML